MCISCPKSFRIVKTPFQTAIFIFLAASLSAQDLIVEPPLPIAPNADEQGYFPTLAESALLRGASDSRSLGRFLEDERGTDSHRQTATDIFLYEDSNPNFYQKNASFFKPLDYSLGWLTSFDSITVEPDSLDNTSLTFDANFSPLTRQFSPELAMLKAGPIYFDLLWVGAGYLWSDYSGNRDFEKFTGSTSDVDGDGPAAYIDVGFRTLVRLSDSIYLTATGNLIYLPYENELGLRFGSGRDSALYSRFNYSETFGAWDILLYDEFRGMPGLNWFGQANANEIDRSGRYFYGFQNYGPANEFYSNNYVFFTNKLGFNATRLVLENKWRFGTSIDRTDYWSSFSFENHQTRDHAGIWLGYEGSTIPFAPRLSYDIYSFDGYESIWHRAYFDLTGRLTENVQWFSRVGAGLTTGQEKELDRFLWQIGLEHTITKNTLHWIRIGEDVFDSEINAESLTSRFVRWGIDQRIDRRLYFRAFVQYAEGETVLPSLQVRDRFGAGVSIRFQPLDFTQIVGTALYEKIDQNLPLGEGNRWLYRGEINQQLGLRLTGQLFYQYETNNVNIVGFKEHLLGLSVRRYF